MHKKFFIYLLVFIQLFVGLVFISVRIHEILPSIADRLSYSFGTTTRGKNYITRNSYNLSPNVHIVDLSIPINVNNTCVKTKTLLNYISTHICLHETNTDMIVSGTYRENNTIWEEYGVTQILRLLIRYPHLDFIDVGANIGTYTMYAAALGRFVLAIDCFASNLARIQQAVQLANVGNRVVLVQNAIYIRSGEFLRLSAVKDNIGAQAIEVPKNQKNTVHVPNNRSISDPYIVKTITFDELLPIFMARGVRGALMKIDIEGSESFVVQKGARVFEKLDIPFVQMEWHIVRLHADRVKVILDFFIKLNYDPMTCACAKLDPVKYSSWPSDICWIKQNFSDFC